MGLRIGLWADRHTTDTCLHIFPVLTAKEWSSEPECAFAGNDLMSLPPMYPSPFGQSLATTTDQGFSRESSFYPVNTQNNQSQAGLAQLLELASVQLRCIDCTLWLPFASGMWSLCSHFYFCSTFKTAQQDHSMDPRPFFMHWGVLLV